MSLFANTIERQIQTRAELTRAGYPPDEIDRIVAETKPLIHAPVVPIGTPQDDTRPGLAPTAPPSNLPGLAPLLYNAPDAELPPPPSLTAGEQNLGGLFLVGAAIWLFFFLR